MTVNCPSDGSPSSDNGYLREKSKTATKFESINLQRDFVALGQGTFANKLDNFGEILFLLKDFLALRSVCTEKNGIYHITPDIF